MTVALPETRKKAMYYFMLVGLLSILWVALFIISHPSWVQTIKEWTGITPVLQASEDSFYNGRIDPIFEKYCTACHDEDKGKGQLRLDSFRQLTFSGRSGADLTAAEKNLLIERMTLPPTDRLAMPPYGRLRHSEAELEIIKLWLSKGGTGTATEADFPEAPAKAKVIKFKDIDWQEIAELRVPMEAAVKSLQQAFPHAVQYLARTSHLISVDLSIIDAKIDDEQFALFEPVRALISELNLKQTVVSDQSLSIVQTMSSLETLNLVDTNVSSNFLLQLINMPNLKKVFTNIELATENVHTQYSDVDIELIVVERP